MEAQAAGCVPVSSPTAALAETVKAGIKINVNDHQNFVDTTVKLLKQHSMWQLYSKDCIEAGKSFSMESLAKDWLEMFDEKVVVPKVEKKLIVAPEWRGEM